MQTEVKNENKKLPVDRVLNFVADIDKDETTILLNGAIGGENGISGDQFAMEIAFVQEQTELINIRINSVGGDVIQGYSIISAILNCEVPVNTYNDGMAASIASCILFCGKHICSLDFAGIMIHNPFKANGKDDASTDFVREQLISIYLKRTKMSRKKIEAIMDAETFFTADEALKLGLIDEIIDTGILQMEGIEEMSMENRLEIYNELKNNNIQMDNFKVKYEELLIENKSKFDKFVDQLAEAKKNKEETGKLYDELKAKYDEMEAKVAASEEEKEKEQDDKVGAMLDSFIAKGALKAEEKEAMKILAKTNFELVSNTLSKIGNAKSIDVLASLPKPIVGKDYQSYVELSRNPEDFKKMQKENPARFQELYQAAK
jgi:ATP-dependent protease ClpP protease subunit